MTLLRLTLLLLLVTACATVPEPVATVPSPDPGGFGLVVMAHGGSEVWNREVEAAVVPLREEYPVELAFGMADAVTLQAAVERLEAQGSTRIAVVRLFVSGESWRKRTEQMLGLRPGAPAREAPAAIRGPAQEHAGHGGGWWRLESRAVFGMSASGLAEAAEMGEVLVERVRALSSHPGREQVLIVAHGPGDDAENLRWLEWLDDRAEAVRAAGPFPAVRAMTLREDWPEQRTAAVRDIRQAVSQADAAGLTTLVVPFRVQGFGPYAAVLEGLPYRADHQGLLPHPAVTRWIAEQARLIRAELESRPR